MLNFRSIPPIGRWLFIGLCACLLSLHMGPAHANSPFFWDFIDVDITLETDGDLLVTETQKYTFTAAHTNQRYRYIPLDRVDQISDVEVYENDQRLPAEVGTQQNQLWIRWQHALNPPESHTFVLKYRVIGGVQVQGQTSKIYWQALFPERNAPIQRSNVTIHLPDALSGTVTQFHSEGIASVNQALNPQTFEFTVDQPLAPKQFLNVSVRFPSDILNLTPPRWQSRATAQTRSSASNRADTARRNSGSSAPVWIMMGLIGLVTCFSVCLRKRCPQCHKRTLNRSSRVLAHATRNKSGSREVRHSCSSCDYRRTNTEVIPKLSSPSNTSYGGYSGGGYTGGGYSGGGYGGGASGGSSGGGCSGGGGGG